MRLQQQRHNVSIAAALVDCQVMNEGHNISFGLLDAQRCCPQKRST